MENPDNKILSVNRIEQVGDIFKDLAGEIKVLIYLHSEDEEEGESLQVRTIPASIVTTEVLLNPKIHNLVVAQEGNQKTYQIVSGLLNY